MRRGLDSVFFSEVGTTVLSGVRFLEGTLLCVCYLENHVFLGTRIDRKISARHVFLSTMRNCEPLPVVQHQTVSSQVLMVKSYRYQDIQPSFNPHYDAPKYGDR